MADEKPNERTPEGEPKTDQDRGKGDYIALGIGCLVTAIFFGSILVAGLLSGR